MIAQELSEKREPMQSQTGEILLLYDTNDIYIYIYNFSADTQRALEAVERLQAKLKERGEAPTQEKLSLLKTVLQSPLFHHILSLQQTQRKPLAKVQRRHDCVGVWCILNSGEGAGIIPKILNAGTKLDE